METPDKNVQFIDQTKRGVALKGFSDPIPFHCNIVYISPIQCIYLCAFYMIIAFSLHIHVTNRAKIASSVINQKVCNENTYHFMLHAIGGFRCRMGM